MAPWQYNACRGQRSLQKLRGSSVTTVHWLRPSIAWLAILPLQSPSWSLSLVRHGTSGKILRSTRCLDLRAIWLEMDTSLLHE